MASQKKPFHPSSGSPWKGEAARLSLSLPLERGGGAKRRRGPIRPLPPSVEETAFPPGPLDSALPKGGGRLVSTHAALSPELGSSLKARSGCKSRTTAPGVQGAGRGPLATSLVTFLFAQERNPPVGAGPDNPSGRMPENSKEGKPLPRGSHPAGMPENPGGETPQTPPPPLRSNRKAAAAWYPPTPHSALS